MKSKIRRRYFYEKFKAALLILLVILCIVQLGILWSSQSGSFPFSFYESTPVSIEKAKGSFLLPYRVIISTGFDKEHYVIPNGSEDYNTLWNGAKQFISEALENKPKKVKVFNEDDWGILVSNKEYTFEFKTPIPIQIFKWVLSIQGSFGEGLSSIYKVVVCPDDPDNNYSDMLYIRDDKKIYIYEVSSLNNSSLEQGLFNSVLERQKAYEYSKSYRMAIEKYRKTAITQDLIGPFIRKSTEQYPDITVNSISDKYGESLSDIAKSLFGRASSDYDYGVDITGYLVFKKSEMVYKLRENSLLEYTFTGSQGTTDKLSVSDAYKEAVRFILEHDRLNGVMSGISIYLKSVKENKSTYTFEFDYSIPLGQQGEVPILLNANRSDEGEANSFISIEASSKKVKSCKWVMLKFDADNNKKIYSWNFEEMHDSLYEKYGQLDKDEGGDEISIQDFGIYYVVPDLDTTKATIKPSFVLFTKKGGYDINLKGNK